MWEDGGDCGDNVPELVVVGDGGGSGLEYESNGDGEDEAVARARPACRRMKIRGSSMDIDGDWGGAGCAIAGREEKKRSGRIKANLQLSLEDQSIIIDQGRYFA